jgi:SPP1 gp7 family putative phage head morphogenesis protein
VPRRDPRRFTGRPLTLNEILLDRGVRHALFLEGLKTHQARQVIRFLDEKVYPDLVETIAGRLERIAFRGFDRGPLVTKRLRVLRDSVDTIIDRGFALAGQNLRTDLLESARMERTFQTELIRPNLQKFDVEWVAPSARQLRSAVLSRPFQGRVLREWWGGVTTSTRQLVRDRISIGITNGETTQQIVRAIRGRYKPGRLPSAEFGTGTLARTRANVEAVVRTAVNHSVTSARHVGYEENTDTLQGWQFVATLDGRTTHTCAILDGMIFPIGEGPKPPRHYGCRSSDVPVVKTAEELGLPALDLPPEERAALGGPVSGTTTYPAWLKRQPAAVQNFALGEARAAKFRRGEITVDRYRQDIARTLTPNQLLELERGIAGIEKAVGSVGA